MTSIRAQAAYSHILDTLHGHISFLSDQGIIKEDSLKVILTELCKLDFNSMQSSSSLRRVQEPRTSIERELPVLEQSRNRASMPSPIIPIASPPPPPSSEPRSSSVNSQTSSHNHPKHPNHPNNIRRQTTIPLEPSDNSSDNDEQNRKADLQQQARLLRQEQLLDQDLTTGELDNLVAVSATDDQDGSEHEPVHYVPPATSPVVTPAVLSSSTDPTDSASVSDTPSHRADEIHHPRAASSNLEHETKYEHTLTSPPSTSAPASIAHVANLVPSEETSPRIYSPVQSAGVPPVVFNPNQQFSPPPQPHYNVPAQVYQPPVSQQGPPSGNDGDMSIAGILQEMEGPSMHMATASERSERDQTFSKHVHETTTSTFESTDGRESMTSVDTGKHSEPKAPTPPPKDTAPVTYQPPASIHTTVPAFGAPPPPAPLPYNPLEPPRPNMPGQAYQMYQPKPYQPKSTYTSVRKPPTKPQETPAQAPPAALQTPEGQTPPQFKAKFQLKAKLQFKAKFQLKAKL
ncbi:hypothetical protein BG000_009597, partial [Podila horticola]